VRHPTKSDRYLELIPMKPPAPSVIVSVQSRLSGKPAPSKQRDWGPRGSEQYRQANREYMRHYREHPMRRERENAFRKQRRRRRRSQRPVARQAAERNLRGRLLKLANQRSYYGRFKKRGWRRVRIFQPCIACSAPTRWRRWCLSGEVGVDLTTRTEKIVDLKWQWLAGCRDCKS